MIIQNSLLYSIQSEENGRWIKIDSISITANSSHTFNGLQPGEYKVVEEEIPLGYYLISIMIKKLL